MKGTAFALFPNFCNYEIAVLLEMLALNEKPVTFFGTGTSPVKCEEGMTVVPDAPYDDCNVGDFDSLVISGSYAEGQYYNFADEKLLELIRRFDAEGRLIAAISSGPMVLCRADVTRGRKIIAGVDREWYLTDPQMSLRAEQMESLIDQNAMIAMKDRGEPIPDYVRDGNLLTAPGWKFREWALAVGEALGLKDCYPGTFGL